MAANDVLRVYTPISNFLIGVQYYIPFAGGVIGGTLHVILDIVMLVINKLWIPKFESSNFANQTYWSSRTLFCISNVLLAGIPGVCVGILNMFRDCCGAG